MDVRRRFARVAHYTACNIALAVLKLEHIRHLFRISALIWRMYTIEQLLRLLPGSAWVTDAVATPVTQSHFGKLSTLVSNTVQL